MSISELNKKIIQIGTGLMAKIKFDFFFSYDPYDVLKLRHQKQQLFQTKLHKSIYKK